MLGLDPQRDTAALRRSIGSQLQTAALPERMKVAEAVRLFAYITGDVVDWRDVMSQWDLERLARSPFRALSGGSSSGSSSPWPWSGGPTWSSSTS